jgi:hypothetical protein
VAIAKHDLALGVLGKKERARQVLKELPEAIGAHTAEPLVVSGVGHGVSSITRKAWKTGAENECKCDIPCRTQ